MYVGDYGSPRPATNPTKWALPRRWLCRRPTNPAAWTSLASTLKPPLQLMETIVALHYTYYMSVTKHAACQFRLGTEDVLIFQFEGQLDAGSERSCSAVTGSLPGTDWMSHSHTISPQLGLKCTQRIMRIRYVHVQYSTVQCEGKETRGLQSLNLTVTHITK